MYAAGGFVNSFGRINGNLNLSRSLGDLKYKQNKNLSPAQQVHMKNGCSKSSGVNLNIAPLICLSQ